MDRCLGGVILFDDVAPHKYKRNVKSSERLGWDGVVITDDMGMGAITPYSCLLAKIDNFQLVTFNLIRRTP